MQRPNEQLQRLSSWAINYSDHGRWVHEDGRVVINLISLKMKKETFFSSKVDTKAQQGRSAWSKLVVRL